MKKQTLLALVLCLVLLLQACSGIVPRPTETEAWPLLSLTEPGPTETTEPIETVDLTEPAESTEPPAPTEPPEIQVPAHVDYRDYERRYEPRLEPRAFSELAYERPDAQSLKEDLQELTQMVLRGADLDSLTGAYERSYDSYCYFSTMGTLAYIRHTLDLNDAYYDEENAWCEEQTPLVNQALEECYLAMADSPLRQQLEQELFEPGFFEFYDDNAVYSNDEVVRLMQQESQLTREYMLLMSDMTISWQGRERLVQELLEDPEILGQDYVQVWELYYEKYSPRCAEIYLELVQLRQAMARELGYDSYADFAFDYYYTRDYSPEQMMDYVDAIAEHMAGGYGHALNLSYSYALPSDQVQQLLGQIAYHFGGDIATAYDYMCAYELYDISSSSSKMPGSYMTYLTSYEMPFVYISPTGSSEDIFTAAHEFGHLVDGFVNCNETVSVDCAEIFSQALEFLALDSPVFEQWQREQFRRARGGNALLTFLSQAAYARFEHLVYEQDPEDLDLQQLNELFYDCLEQFGMGNDWIRDILAPGWMDVLHFFEVPYYVISYCTSLDVALQVYQRQQEQGDGLELYYGLLEHASGASIQELLDSCDMLSPFDPGRVEELSSFLAELMY